MTAPARKLTVDEAVAQFFAIVREELGSESAAPRRPQTPEEADALNFRCAEVLFRLACPDPTRCADQRCRRGGQCRLFADLHARRQAARNQEPTRRPHGAAALRHAIWVFMNS